MEWVYYNSVNSKSQASLHVVQIFEAGMGWAALTNIELSSLFSGVGSMINGKDLSTLDKIYKSETSHLSKNVNSLLVPGKVEICLHVAILSLMEIQCICAQSIIHGLASQITHLLNWTHLITLRP